MIAEIDDVARSEGRLVGKNPKFMVGNHEVVDIPMPVQRSVDPNLRPPAMRKIRDMSHVDTSVVPDAMPAPLPDPKNKKQKAAVAPLPETEDTEADDNGVPQPPTDDVVDTIRGALGGEIGGDDMVPTIPPDEDGDQEKDSPIVPDPLNLTPIEAAALNSKDGRVHRSGKSYVLEEIDSNSEFPHHCCVSVRNAIGKWGDAAMTPIKAELSQMIDKDVFAPVMKSNLSPEALSKVIRSHMFLTEKFAPDGRFEKVKARLVAGGDQQDRSTYETVSVTSPTVGLSSLLMVAAIAASERRKCKVIDVTGAYLNANMGNIVVHMRIDGMLASLLVKLCPEYQKFVNQDGSIIVRLKKALYGCIESAKLWYHLLSSTLVSGYRMVPNPYDPCVVNLIVPSGDQLTVIVYVDDLFISCKIEAEIDNVVRFIVDRFKTITEHDGFVLSYLGMSLDFSEDGKVKITMPGYVNDVLENLEDTKEVSTPATATLFDIEQDEARAPLLPRKEAKVFHTMVAKLLYLAKRARPDILTAVSFLTSRVQSPTVEDQAKLTRVLKYLNGTRALGIVLVHKHNYPVAFCDASYGVHHDLKSHTGLFITLGEGPIFVGSSKQKIVVKSSTEAELVALSDASNQILWTREFLCVQLKYAGSECMPAVIKEDNMSTITLLRTDKAQSQRTKHINIRYFYLKDRQDHGEVVIEHMPTGEMIADVLTKPLQGSQFMYLRSKLLNHS